MLALPSLPANSPKKDKKGRKGRRGGGLTLKHSRVRARVVDALAARDIDAEPLLHPLTVKKPNRVGRRKLYRLVLRDVEGVAVRAVKERLEDAAVADLRRDGARELHLQHGPRIVRIQLDGGLLALGGQVAAAAGPLERGGHGVGDGLVVRLDAVGVVPGEVGEVLALQEEVGDAVDDAEVGDADGALGGRGLLGEEVGCNAGGPVAAAAKSPSLAASS